MTHDRELLYAQRVRDARDVRGRRSHIAAAVGSRTGVSRPVVRHPAYTEPVGGREQRLRRRADIRRAMVPEHNQAIIRKMPAGVVDMQSAPVAELEIGLGHPLRAAPRSCPTVWW